MATDAKHLGPNQKRMLMLIGDCREKLKHERQEAAGQMALEV